MNRLKQKISLKLLVILSVLLMCTTWIESSESRADFSIPVYCYPAAVAVYPLYLQLVSVVAAAKAAGLSKDHCNMIAGGITAAGGGCLLGTPEAPPLIAACTVLLATGPVGHCACETVY